MLPFFLFSSSSLLFFTALQGIQQSHMTPFMPSYLLNEKNANGAGNERIRSEVEWLSTGRERERERGLDREGRVYYRARHGGVAVDCLTSGHGCSTHETINLIKSAAIFICHQHMRPT